MASETQRALEALIMVADRPVEPQLLAQLLEVSVQRVDELCSELAAHYEADERGFQLVRVAGGYRYQSHPDEAAYVERFALEGQSARLSAAALETLAVVAYKQPVSRAQVSAIRGVNVDGVMRTLTQRGYIDEVSRDPGPGQAIMYGTTTAFLERLGIDRIDDLPPLAQFIPGADVVEALEVGLRITADDVPEAPVDEGPTPPLAFGEGPLPAPSETPTPQAPEFRDQSGDLTSNGDDPEEPVVENGVEPARDDVPPARVDATTVDSNIEPPTPDPPDDLP